jgi:hypothetical protein
MASVDRKVDCVTEEVLARGGQADAFIEARSPLAGHEAARSRNGALV